VPDANTLIRYMYRDDDNYKEYAEVIFKGAITDDERAALIGALDDGELFEPDRVGLESARGWADDSGHTSNELLASEIAIVDRPPTDGRTITEFIAALVAANHMPRFRLTGYYGTFVIERVVEAADKDAAFMQTGITTTLEAAGWTMVESPSGEEWEIAALLPEGRQASA
jgi:hypothetical protein